VAVFQVDDVTPFQEERQWMPLPPPEEWWVNVFGTPSPGLDTSDEEEEDGDPTDQELSPVPLGNDAALETKAGEDDAVDADAPPPTVIPGEAAAMEGGEDGDQGGKGAGEGGAAEGTAEDEDDEGLPNPWRKGDVWVGSYQQSVSNYRCCRFTVLEVSGMDVTVGFQFETSSRAEAAYTLCGRFDSNKGCLAFQPEHWIRKGEGMTTVPITFVDAIYEKGARLSTAAREDLERAGEVTLLCGSVVHRSCGYICLSKVAPKSAPLPPPTTPEPCPPEGIEPARDETLPDLVDAQGAGMDAAGTGMEEAGAEGSAASTPFPPSAAAATAAQGPSLVVNIVHKQLRSYAGYKPYSYKMGSPYLLTVPAHATTDEVIDKVDAIAEAAGANVSLPHTLIYASTSFDETRPTYGGYKTGITVERAADGEAPEQFWSVAEQEAATKHVYHYASKPNPRHVHLVMMWGQVAEATVFGQKSKGEDDREAGEQTMTLQDCLELFRVTEKLSQEDSWYCPRCEDFKEATKKMDLWSTPELLCFHLKRFSMDVGSYWVDKLETPVDIPLEGLDMSSFVHQTSEVNTYTLAAVSNHFGGTGGGHYTAYARNEENGRWYEFDDSHVSPVAAEYPLDRAAAYVLFYIRDDKIPQSWKAAKSSTVAAHTQAKDQDGMSLHDPGDTSNGMDADGFVDV